MAEEIIDNTIIPEEEVLTKEEILTEEQELIISNTIKGMKKDGVSDDIIFQSFNGIKEEAIKKHKKNIEYSGKNYALNTVTVSGDYKPNSKSIDENSEEDFVYKYKPWYDALRVEIKETGIGNKVKTKQGENEITIPVGDLQDFLRPKLSEEYYEKLKAQEQAAFDNLIEEYNGNFDPVFFEESFMSLYNTANLNERRLEEVDSDKLNLERKTNFDNLLNDYQKTEEGKIVVKDLSTEIDKLQSITLEKILKDISLGKINISEGQEAYKK